ncbi:MAG: SpoVR family protein, partial [Bdellovibrionales bacterium]|nr:SpoVR family protein [Bdellovibrionales bacterium]
MIYPCQLVLNLAWRFSWRLVFLLFVGGMNRSIWAQEREGGCRPLLSESQSETSTEIERKGRSNKSKFLVIESPRAIENAKFYRDYVEGLTQPGGVLDRLGIEMAGQVVEFVPPMDLQALTSGSSGGYPVAHYLDGASVLESMKPKRGFALEVVYPGPANGYSHGIYRDDNNQDQQVSIIDHVVGHNHFSLHSGLPHYRVGQALVASRKLDRVLKDAYVSFDQDQVMRWYLFVQTLVPLMDYFTPLWESVESFLPQLQVRGWDPQPMQSRRPQVLRHPKRITENVLQAFTANLGSSSLEFEKEALSRIIESMAFRPALVHTQIMNEGWASIQQELLPRHTGRNHTFEFWLNASGVMQTEKVVNIRDPYSLGVFCWRHLKKRFLRQPEIAGL